jgi:RNA polymerase sigma-70 factor (ECF subfamily)
MPNHKTYNDQQLLDLLKNGDEAAFTEIYDRYSALLLIHADNKLHDEDEARDVVQDVFVRLWEKRDQINVSSNLSGYLYSTVRNQIFNMIKHQKVISTYTKGLLDANTNNQIYADHLIREKQFAAMIEAEIAALPPRMRQVFELRRLENLSNKEVAAKLGVTELTATDQMKKAMKILRIRIGLMIIIASIIRKCV